MMTEDDVTLEIKMKSGQENKTATIEFLFCNSNSTPAFVYQPSGDWHIDWRPDPNICLEPMARNPILYYMAVEAQIPPGVAIGLYSPPDLIEVGPGEKLSGSFSIGEHIEQAGVDADGFPSTDKIQLPDKFDIEMVLGYGLSQPNISFKSETPLADFLDWQKYVTSNQITLSRKTVWSQSEGN